MLYSLDLKKITSIFAKFFNTYSVSKIGVHGENGGNKVVCEICNEEVSVPHYKTHKNRQGRRILIFVF